MEEIIIDGVDVAGCEFYSDYDKTCREANGKFDTDLCDFDKCEYITNCYYKQLKRLEQENAKLKEEIEIRDNLSEKFRKEALSWANIANECQKDKTKLEQTLQEIKAIVTGVRSYLEVPAPRDVRYEMDRILNLITKAEEE